MTIWKNYDLVMLQGVIYLVDHLGSYNGLLRDGTKP